MEVAVSAQSPREKFFRTLLEELPLKYHECLESPSVKYWIDKLYKQRESKIEPKTACKDIRIVFEFAEFCSGKIPSAESAYESMIQDARSLKSDANSKGRYKYEDLLDNWFDHLKETEGLKQNVAREKLVVVNSFFYWNRVELDLKLPASSRQGHPYAPTREELRRAFVSTPDRVLRWWILLQSQSGLSEIDIINLDLNLKNEDPKKGPIFDSIKDQIAQGKCPVHIVIPREKTGIITITCIGEEGLALFERPVGDRLRMWWQEGRPADPTRFVRRQFERIQERVQNELLAPHSLRRYLESNLEASGINQNVVRRFMGHSVGKKEGPYSAPPVKRFEKIYEFCYPYLRLFPAKYVSTLGEIAPEDLTSTEMQRDISQLEELEFKPMADRESGS